MRLNPGVILIANFFFLIAWMHFTGSPKTKYSQNGSDSLPVPTPKHRCAPWKMYMLFNLISCCLLFVILLLPKIFYTTLYSLAYHKMQGSIFEKHLNSFVTFYSSSKPVIFIYGTYNLIYLPNTLSGMLPLNKHKYYQ